MPSAETLWGLGRAVLLGLLLLVLLVRMFEERLVFFPDRYATNEWDPGRMGVEVEDVFFTTADSVRLHAWWAPASSFAKATEDKPAEQAPGAPDALLTILYFHGNAGNLTNRIENIAFLRQLPANVLAVDYRGYGKSEGRPTEAGVYLDAQAAYDYLFHERSVVPDQLVVLGQSLGVAVAVDLASKRPVAGLILEGGFPSAGRVVQRTMGLPGLRFVIRSKFDSAAKLKEISVPVLVAHCTRDPILPYALGEELYAAAHQPKTFVSYDSDYHEPLFFADPSDYAARLRAFLKSATEAQGPRD